MKIISAIIFAAICQSSMCFFSSTQQYDSIMTIEAFQAITDNRVNILYKNKATEEIFKSDKFSKSIGLLGLRNKGKTFFLNKLVQSNFPSGYEVNTEGISIKVSEDQYQIHFFMDSKGLSQPAIVDWSKFDLLKKRSYNSEEIASAIRSSFEDINLIEKIQHDIIMDVSQMILVMVDDVQREDQKLIEQLIYQCNQETDSDKKQIYIIHNLKNFGELKDIEEYESRMNIIFPLIKKDRGIYHDKRNKNISIEHLIFAKDGTKGAEVYNQQTLKRIKSAFESKSESIIFNESLKQSLTKAVKRYGRIFNKNLLNTFNTESLYSIESIDCKQLNLKLFESSIDLQTPYCAHLALNNTIKVEQQKSLVQDSIGIFKTFFLYEVIQTNVNELIIFADIPGRINIESYYLNHQYFRFAITVSRTGLLDTDYSEPHEESYFKFVNKNSKVLERNFSLQDTEYEVQLPWLDVNKFYSIQMNPIRNNFGQIVIKLKITSKYE